MNEQYENYEMTESSRIPRPPASGSFAYGCGWHRAWRPYLGWLALLAVHGAKHAAGAVTARERLADVAGLVEGGCCGSGPWLWLRLAGSGLAPAVGRHGRSGCGGCSRYCFS